MIPSSIADVYSKLKEEVIWVHGRWIIYKQLFEESKERVELLNESAGVFFYIIQKTLISEIQITLSKLTDPHKTGRFDNLSLGQLEKRILSSGESVLHKNFSGNLKELILKCEPFRSNRNKQLAHLDLDVALQANTTPLPGITLQMIEDALSDLRDLMNYVELKYNDTEYGYQYFHMRSDGESLVATLKFGLRYQELRESREIPSGDWQKGKWKNA